MKQKRFSVEQIVATLKQIELGMKVAEASRQLGVSEQAIYRWKNLYGGTQSDQVSELKVLQDENARLTKPVAGLSLDKAILQDIYSKMARPAVKREALDYVRSHYQRVNVGPAG